MTTTTQVRPESDNSRTTVKPAERSSNTQPFSPCLVPLLCALPAPTAQPLPTPRADVAPH
jgi:hypothetical protein